MPCFVNLPLRWVHANPAWLDWYIAGRVNPELGLDAVSLALPDAWHERTAARFREAGLACSIHLPFINVEPCDLSATNRIAARADLRRGAAIARIYGAAHMIGHPWFRQERDVLADGSVRPEWHKHAFEAWRDIPELGGSVLFLENTRERAYDPIAALVTAIMQDTGCAGRPENTLPIGLCFDVGHWHAFAKYSRPEEMLPWLDAAAPLRLHLHLHDNNGSSDQHLGLGTGDIPLEFLFAELAKRNKNVTASLEPHEIDAFTISVQWLEKHPEIARRLDWRPPDVSAMPLATMAQSFPETGSVPT